MFRRSQKMINGGRAGEEAITTCRCTAFHGLKWTSRIANSLRMFRPFSDSGGFPAVVELHYPIDLIGKYVWLPISITIRHLQHVIKAKADELQLLRTQAGRGRIFLEYPALSGLPVVMLQRLRI